MVSITEDQDAITKPMPSRGESFGDSEDDSLEETRPLHSDATEAAEPSFAWLAIVVGPDRGRLVRLRLCSNSVGRGVDNDIVLRDAAVSTRHAVVEAKSIETGGHVWLLRDLKSRNHTYVNGNPVSEHNLADCDRIGLGKTGVVFRCL